MTGDSQVREMGGSQVREMDGSQVRHVGRAGVAVVGQSVDAVETEEVFGAVGQFEFHAAGRPLLERPEVADPPCDADASRTAVTALGGHTGRTAGDDICLSAAGDRWEHGSGPLSDGRMESAPTATVK